MLKRLRQVALVLLALGFASSALARAIPDSTTFQWVGNLPQCVGVNGTAADGFRFWEFDCNDATDPSTPSADKARLWCDKATPDVLKVTLDDASTPQIALNACTVASQNAGTTCLTAKGGFPVGQGGSSAAVQESPGADGTYKQADAAGAHGWADKYPFILDTVKIRSVATNRGGSSSPSDDSDGGAGDDLIFTAAANTTYIVVLDALFSSDTAGRDLKFGYNIPSGTIDGIVFASGTGSDAARVNADVTAVTVQLIAGNTGVHSTVRIAVTTGGTVAFWWSGQSGAGTVQIEAGSIMTVYRTNS